MTWTYQKLPHSTRANATVRICVSRGLPLLLLFICCDVYRVGAMTASRASCLQLLGRLAAKWPRWHIIHCLFRMTACYAARRSCVLRDHTPRFTTVRSPSALTTCERSAAGQHPVQKPELRTRDLKGTNPLRITTGCGYSRDVWRLPQYPTRNLSSPRESTGQHRSKQKPLSPLLWLAIQPNRRGTPMIISLPRLLELSSDVCLGLTSQIVVAERHS